MTVPIVPILSGLASFITEPLRRWQEKKRAKQDIELEIAKATKDAKIKKIQTKEEGDIAWENTSIKNAGWKDEWCLVLLSIPAILCFIPGFDVYVTKGFEALDKCPDWYKWAFLVAVASSFGYKKLADFMALKKGS